MPLRQCRVSGCRGRHTASGAGLGARLFHSALLAYGVAAALYHRERSGQGQYLSLSLLRSALTIQAGRFVWAESEGRDVARDSGAGGLTGIHPTKEGWLYV
jgi:crotonobetainyl-CoA:carnitine CoA-transferase CaiB-like acyl-CoA transferase